MHVCACVQVYVCTHACELRGSGASSQRRGGRDVTVMSQAHSETGQDSPLPPAGRSRGQQSRQPGDEGPSTAVAVFRSLETRGCKKVNRKPFMPRGTWGQCTVSFSAAQRPGLWMCIVNGPLYREAGKVGGESTSARPTSTSGAPQQPWRSLVGGKCSFLPGPLPS